MSDDDGNVIDFEKKRGELRRVLGFEKQESSEGAETLTCSSCEDTFFMLVYVEDMDMTAIICQHCHEPVGYGFLFEEDEE